MTVTCSALEAGGTAVPLSEVALVDTLAACVVLRPAGTARPAPREAIRECTCTTDFRCETCNYGVAAGHLPEHCPMCGGHTWRPCPSCGSRRAPRRASAPSAPASRATRG